MHLILLKYCNVFSDIANCFFFIYLIFHSGNEIKRIYPPELQLNKPYAPDTEAQFLDLDLSIVHAKFMISMMTLILT